MASGGGKKQQFPSKTSKETCVFCDRLELQQNMKRHITQYCEVARAECAGLDVMKEAEKRSAKRKGLVGVKTMFQSKPKSAKTGTVDREELLMDDDDAQMDTDELNNQLLNLDETLEADTNVVHHEPNPIDERILEKLDNMSIGIGEGFNSVCERLNRLEKEKGKELPPIARPEDIGPVDERSWDLNKCVSLDDILQLLVEMKLEEEDGVPLIYCSLCCPENGVTGYLQNGVFQLTGPASDDNGKMTKAFSNLKISIKRHINQKCHTDQLDLWRAKEQMREKEKGKNHAAGMRVARIAYAGFEKGRSLRDFEEQVLLGKCLKTKCKIFFANPSSSLFCVDLAFFSCTKQPSSNMSMRRSGFSAQSL